MKRECDKGNANHFLSEIALSHPGHCLSLVLNIIVDNNPCVKQYTAGNPTPLVRDAMMFALVCAGLTLSLFATPAIAMDLHTCRGIPWL